VIIGNFIVLLLVKFVALLFSVLSMCTVGHRKLQPSAFTITLQHHALIVFGMKIRMNFSSSACLIYYA